MISFAPAEPADADHRTNVRPAARRPGAPTEAPASLGRPHDMVHPNWSGGAGGAMRAHHQRVVRRLADHFQADPRFLAMIVGGSVAKGWASDDSDVDVMLIATDQEFAHRLSTGELGYVTEEMSDYPGGYVDGKIIDVAFLRDVADHGSEPARAAFMDVVVAYSHIPDLEALLAPITVYPEHERTAKMRAFA